MNGFNEYTNRSYFGSNHMTAQDSQPNSNQNNSSLHLCDKNRRVMSSAEDPMSPIGVAFNAMPSSVAMAPIQHSIPVCSNPLLSSFESQLPAMGSVQSMSSPMNSSMNCSTKCGFDCNESKTQFNQLINCLENLRQNNERFQTNVLNELKQLKGVMADMKTAINAMPVRFADALTQCMDSMHSRSDSLSVDSEPEVVDIFDKIDISTNDGIEDNGFVEISDKTDLTETEILKNSAFDKFVFPYEPYIDLDKWLKKD